MTSFSSMSFSFGAQKRAEKFWQLFLGPKFSDLSTEDMLANPLLAEARNNILEHFPPTLVVTVETDVYRDEGEAFAALLKNRSANEAKIIRYNRTLHGFMGQPAMRHGQDVIKETVGFIRKWCFSD